MSSAGARSSLLAPEVLTTFVGRGREVAEVRRLLDGARLVTLTGAGGIGKTRLAVHTATGAAPGFTDGVVLVPLGEVADPALVAGTLLETSGAGQQSGRSPLQATVEHFRRMRALLVLDNCEHLLTAVGEAVQELVIGCPRLRVLATSREPLGVAGETVWAVPPLSTAARNTGSTASEAATLFAERAGQATADLDLSGEAAQLVDRIVRGLDGIPLAIELAAARARVLSLSEIASALDDHLRLLTGGPRISEARYQTMRASIDWSHVLLTPQEQKLFRRLSVFANGWTLHAAEQVCADPDTPSHGLLDTLTALVDKSLVLAGPHGPASRFRMLATVRQYAAERLVQAGEADALGERHRRYFTALAQQADRSLWALTDQGRAQLDAEAANLRAAVTNACRAGSPDALRITGALGCYWRERGRLSEGIAATEQALAATSHQPTPDRALALAMMAGLTFWRGDFARTTAAVTEAIGIAEQIGAPRAHAYALARLGCAVMLMDPASGDPMLAHSVELAERANDPISLSDALTCQALSYMFQDAYPLMEQAALRAMRVAEAIGFDNDQRWCLWCCAHQALTAGELAQARQLAQQAWAMHGGEDPFSRACAVEALSLCDTLSGDPRTGRDRAEAELDRARQETVRLGTGALVYALAQAALADGDLDSARLWACQLFEQEREGAGYLAWHAQEVLMLAALACDDPAAAMGHADQLTAVAERLRNTRAAGVASCGRARAHLLEGDAGRAAQLAHQVLATAAHEGWWLDSIDAIEVLAAVAVHREQFDRAAQLLAGADAARAQRGLRLTRPDRLRHDALLSAAADVLGDEGIAAACEETSAMSLRQLAEYVGRGRGRRARPELGWASLTPVEAQVAALAAQGLANPQIAERLFIARSTVKVHLSHVFAKLQVSNRTELAALSRSSHP